MNRANFLAQLRAGLSGLHQSDINDVIADYESHFADGVAAGRTEDEVAAALGDPARLARELRAEIGFKRWEQVGFPEALTICKIESCLKIFSGVFRYDNLKKSSDLRGDLRGNII